MSWLVSIIGFLNSNSGAITAGATVILVGITCWYVILTKDILKASNKPQIILYLHHEGGDVSLCVQNIGTGYASDITFEGNLFSFIPKRPGEKALKELEPYNSGINYLGPGYKIETFLFSGAQALRLPRESLNAVVSYKDSTDTKEKKPFAFEFGNWENTSQFVSPQIDDTANKLGRIARAVESVSNHHLSDNDYALSLQIREFLNKLERIADLLEKKTLK